VLPISPQPLGTLAPVAWHEARIAQPRALPERSPDHSIYSPLRHWIIDKRGDRFFPSELERRLVVDHSVLNHDQRRTRSEAVAMDVMLIEDNELLRETLEDEFGEAGLEVLGLPCAEAALSAVENNTAAPAVIVTDVQLGPGMNGLMLAAELRRRWPEVNILVITGNEENLTGMSDGQRSSCFIKPFELARLTAAVMKLLGAAGSDALPRRSCGLVR
jgi:CheY-like chemotaxis protein